MFGPHPHTLSVNSFGQQNAIQLFLMKSGFSVPKHFVLDNEFETTSNFIGPNLGIRIGDISDSDYPWPFLNEGSGCSSGG